MPNYWIKALKEYNKDNDEYCCVPRKVSKNYLKLQRIVNNYDAKPSQEDALMKSQSFCKK